MLCEGAAEKKQKVDQNKYTSTFVKAEQKAEQLHFLFIPVKLQSVLYKGQY